MAPVAPKGMNRISDQLLKACDLYAKTCRGPGNREYLVGYLSRCSSSSPTISRKTGRPRLCSSRPGPRARIAPATSAPRRPGRVLVRARSRGAGRSSEPLAVEPIPPEGDPLQW